MGLAAVGFEIGSTIAGVCAAGGVGRVGLGNSVFGSTFCTAFCDKPVMPPVSTPGTPELKLTSMIVSRGPCVPNAHGPTTMATAAMVCATADTSIILRRPSGSRARAAMVLETRSELIDMAGRSAAIRQRTRDEADLLDAAVLEAIHDVH